MVNNVWQWLQLVVESCFNWFTQLLNATSFTSVWLTVLFMVLVHRFLIKPLFGGSSGSDRVKKKTNSNSSSDGD